MVATATRTAGRSPGGAPHRAIEVPKVSLHQFLLAGDDPERDRAAIVDAASGRIVSRSELSSAVQRTASALRARGLASGDVVGLCCPNSPEFVIAYYSVLTAGGTVTTMSPQATAHEAAAQLRDSRARWLMTTEELASRLAGNDAVNAMAETFVFGGGPGTPFASLCEAPQASVELPVVGTDDVAVILYSSGTTGLPKGVVLTHRNLVAGLCILRGPEPVSPDDVVLAALPMHHISGMEIVMNHAVAAGATLVTMPRFDMEEFLANIERHRVTRTVVAPPIVLALSKHPAVVHHDLSSLRVLLCGAAPLSGALARECARRLGCRVKQGYGMTESPPMCIAPDDGPDKPESIGPPAPGVECRIVDPATGVEVLPGQTGELWSRSPAQMREYLGNAAATAATVDPEGWLHTGDLVRADADGWIHVVDRLKELIKYKGYQVAPAELEALLLEHPAVADAAVVGSPDKDAGEVPKAFVVLKHPVTASVLLEFVAERVSPHRRVRFIEFIDQVPKSPSGKILRRILVERERATATSRGVVAATR